MEKTFRKTMLTVSKEALFLLLTIAAAVILPQILHGIGMTFGVGGKLGQMFLPMYLPVLLIGFSRGRVSGTIAGLVTPLVSFALTAMPSAALLPFITIELTATGLLAGQFSRAKMPVVCRVLTVQVVAKAIRLAALALSLYMTSGVVAASSLFAGVVISLPGVVLQWAVVGAFLAKRGRRNA
ncbi:MAG: ECF transporter S component [Clostridia bacterium]|nr:ECF transporter S component [Clostridia bacterium]